MKKYSFSKVLKSRGLVAMCVCAGLAWAGIVTAAPPTKPVKVPEFALVGQNVGMAQDLGSLDPNAPPTDVNDGSAYGTIAVGSTRVRTFEIRNYGTADLEVSSPLTLSGPQAGDFTILAQGATTIAPGQKALVDIQYHPGVAGNSVALVTIVNNDPDEGNYSFAISGGGSTDPIVGQDLTSNLVFYKQYNAKGIPLLLCKMTGRVDVTNISYDTDAVSSLVRVWVVDGDIIAPDYSNAFLVDEVVVKKLKKVSVNKKGKTKVSAKRVSFHGQVPPHYKYIFAEVLPIEPSGDVDYANNLAKYLYGL